MGYAANYQLSGPAEFVSEPLSTDALVGGLATLRIALVDNPQPVYGAAFGSALTYAIDAVDDSGAVLLPVASGEVPSSALQIGSTPQIGSYQLAVPPTPLPAGARLRLHMQFSGVYTSTMRLLWAGDYADAGLSLQTGVLALPGRAAPANPAPRASGGSQAGGALAPGLLLLGLLLAWRRVVVGRVVAGRAAP